MFLVLKTNPDKGKSIYTSKKIKKGRLVIQQRGRKVNFEEAKTYDQNYMLEINKNTLMLASNSLDDYINHSCDPNCRLSFRRNKVYLVAIRDINENEEITFDYMTSTSYEGMTTFKNWVFDCSCHSDLCQKKVTCAEFLPIERLKYYNSINALSPHIKYKLR